MTVGIVGLGSIGRAVGALATAFGCRVIAARRQRPGPTSGEAVRSPADADRVCARPAARAARGVATSSSWPRPSPPTTRGAHNGETLALVKPGAWLINVARGRLVDERALLRALRDGRIGGAVLDTFRDEPLPPTSPLVRPAERHRHAAHVVVERPRPRPQRRAVLRQPPPLSRRRAAGQRRSIRRAGTRHPGDNRPMQIAIVGLAGSGKTTVFNTLTRGPGRDRRLRRGHLNVGVVKVPDERLDRLAAIFKPEEDRPRRRHLRGPARAAGVDRGPRRDRGAAGRPPRAAARLRRAAPRRAGVRGSRPVPHRRGSVDPRPRPRAARPRVHARGPGDGRAPPRAAAGPAGRHGTPAEREANEREEVVLRRGSKPALEAGRPIRDLRPRCRRGEGASAASAS